MKKNFFFYIGPGWHELYEAYISGKQNPGKQKSSPDTLKPGQHQGLVDAPVCLVSESDQLPRDMEQGGGSQKPGGLGCTAWRGGCAWPVKDGEIGRRNECFLWRGRWRRSVCESLVSIVRWPDLIKVPSRKP